MNSQVTSQRKSFPWGVCSSGVVMGILLGGLAFSGGFSLHRSLTPPAITAPAVSQEQAEQSLLWAISQVESPSGKPGKAGELSIYQISPAVMAEYWAGHPTATEWVSYKDIALWHLHRLIARHGSFDPAALARLWLGHEDAGYVSRVTNLYSYHLNQSNKE